MAKANKGAAKKPNFFARTGQYFKDVRTELRRVVWPTRKEVVSSSMIVIVTLLFFIAFTLVIDAIASYLFIDLLAQVGR